MSSLHGTDPRQPDHCTPQVLLGLLDDGWADGPEPLYQKLADALRDVVEHGFLATGTRLPPERELAQALYVGRSTVVAAYEVLRDEGRLARQQGSGTWIRGRHPGTFGDELALSTVAQDPYLSGFIDPSPAHIDLTVPMPTAALDTLFDAVLPQRLGTDLLRETTPIGYQPRGLESLRERLAAYLSARDLPTTSDQILITSGAQQAISLILTLFVRPQDEVIVEDPTHRGLIDSLLFNRIRAVPLHVDEVSVPARMATLLDQHAPRLIFLTPTCQHPTGISLSGDVRREVVRVAGRSSVPIVEDAVLADLSLEPPPPPLASYAEGDGVLLIGSVSKILWGGLRVGWIRASEALISRLARLKALADMGTSAVSQVVVRELLTELEGRILSLQRDEVETTLELMESSLRAHLPEWSWRRPRGGRTLWVQLPRGDGRHFARHALSTGVALSPGDTLSIAGNFTDHLRFPFVYPPDITREACRRLERAWSSYDASGAATGDGTEAVKGARTRATAASLGPGGVD